MIIKDIFVKDIYRDVNPVIKVSDLADESTLFQELDEYVVTRDIDYSFSKLYDGIIDGLKNNKDHIGVWISGYFGSGKSHFLKIISFVLSNYRVCGRNSIEYFRDKVSPSVYSMMQAISRRNINTILFDIDAKSTAGQNEGSIVDTFTKVFNEMLGLSSEISVANFERYLISLDKYDQFKASYQKVSKNNHEWEEDRRNPAFIKSSIVAALLDSGVSSSEDEATGIAVSISKKSNISAEDFAIMVGNYCKSRGKDYTLFFLVDEVGQFISGNVQRMLKLQTIVQELGVKAGGQAWVIVTSQEDIEAVVSGVSNNDFSKIQGRFSTRIKMESRDVKEIIEKRILEKKHEDKISLEAFYEASRLDINTKLELDNRVDMRLYRDSKEFVATYPFIPYQYDMLRNMLTQLRKRTAAGKDFSDAARSMIKLFKESVAKYGDCDLRTVIPLYAFIESIESDLDHSTRLVFARARDNEKLNDFDQIVLKTLYLVKYHEDLETSIRNISALMMSSFDQNRIELMANIEESLERLIDQNFVQRVGDLYTYLTDQEQEINREIIRETFDVETLNKQISDVAFGHIFELSGKYRFDNTHDYPFNRIVDGEVVNNTEHELSFYIKTPRDNTPEYYLPQKSINSVLFDVQDNGRLIEQFTDYIRTEKYLRKKEGTVLTQQQREVLTAKRFELSQMKARAQAALDSAIQNSHIFINGFEVEISNDISSKKRADDSLSRLIKAVYNKMDYINGGKNKNDIEGVFKTSTTIPFDDLAKCCGYAVNDLISHLQTNSSSHATVVVKNVLDKFTRKPYGFNDVDTQWLLSMLFRHGKINLIFEGKTFKGRDVDSKRAMDLLTNRHNLDRVKIELCESITAEQIYRAKAVYDVLFAKSFQTAEINIVETVNASAKELLSAVECIEKQFKSEPRYPGKNDLDEIISVLKDLSDMQSPDLFRYTDQNEQRLRDLRSKYDAIMEFFAIGSPRKAVFDRGLSVLRAYDENKDYLVPDANDVAIQIKEIVSAADSRIPNLNVLCPKLEEFINIAVNSYRGRLKSDVQDELSKIRNEHTTNPDLYDKIGKAIEDCLKGIDEVGSISLMNDKANGVKFSIDTLIESSTTSPPMPPKPVRNKELLRTFAVGRVNIDSEEDVDEVVSELARKLKERLAQGPFDIVW